VNRISKSRCLSHRPDAAARSPGHLDLCVVAVAGKCTVIAASRHRRSGFRFEHHAPKSTAREPPDRGERLIETARGLPCIFPVSARAMRADFEHHRRFGSFLASRSTVSGEPRVKRVQEIAGETAAARIGRRQLLGHGAIAGQHHRRGTAVHRPKVMTRNRMMGAAHVPPRSLARQRGRGSAGASMCVVSNRAAGFGMNFPQPQAQGSSVDGGFQRPHARAHRQGAAVWSVHLGFRQDGRTFIWPEEC